MATLNVEDIADLVAGTLRHFGEFKWTDLSYDLQEYVGFSTVLRQNRMSKRGGEQLQWNITTDDNNEAAWVGLFETEDVDVPDTVVQARVPWKHGKTAYAFERREFLVNMGDRQIYDLVKLRRHQGMVAYAKLFESMIWSLPSSDAEEPYGLLYWIVSNATQGFNGGNPTGFSSGAGNVSSSSYSAWSNWTDQYVDVSEDDLVEKIELALYKTGFMAPVDLPEYVTESRRAIYCNYDGFGPLKKLARAQNDNLGSELAAFSKGLTFQRHPVIPVPQLDGDADVTDPFIGVDWGTLDIVFLEGDEMHEDTHPAPLQPSNVVETRVDMTFNTCCKDRRRNFIITK